MIYSFQSPESIGRDIETLDLSAIVADGEDWTDEVIAAAKRAGSAGVAISLRAPTVATGSRARAPRRLPSRTPQAEPGVALQILTSGTTGPPKRQSIKTRVLERTVFSVTSGEAAPPGAPPEFSYWQFGGIGVCQLIAGAYNGRRIVILERFTVDSWVNAVKTHGITRSGVQPAVFRMLLDADVPKEDLASLDFLISASGPLDPETRDEFEAHFDIPVRLAYGATEFAGSLCAWTEADIAEFGARPSATASAERCPTPQLRIVDPDTGAEVSTGEQGLLEAKITAISDDWIRTTDIASIDEDGFVTLHGRADGAINRGGFKILPETVRRVLISHPSVRDACVVGVPDARLGQVPFAAIEVAAGRTGAVRGRAEGPGPPEAAGVQRARRVRRRRRPSAQPCAEGEPARRRRALRRALKQVVAPGVLAVAVHGRLTARRQQRPRAFEPPRDLGGLDARHAVGPAGNELDKQQPRIGRGGRRHLPHVVVAVLVAHAVQTAVVDDQRRSSIRRPPHRGG